MKKRGLKRGRAWATKEKGIRKQRRLATLPGTARNHHSLQPAVRSDAIPALDAGNGKSMHRIACVNDGVSVSLYMKITNGMPLDNVRQIAPLFG